MSVGNLAVCLCLRSASVGAGQTLCRHTGMLREGVLEGVGERGVPCRTAVVHRHVCFLPFALSLSFLF